MCQLWSAFAEVGTECMSAPGINMIQDSVECFAYRDACKLGVERDRRLFYPIYMDLISRVEPGLTSAVVFHDI